MTTKAQKIEKRHSKQCLICFLLDSTAPKGTDWYVYKESYSCNKNIEYICGECVKGVKEIRNKCIAQVEQPENDILGTFEPWFFKYIGMTKEDRER